MEQLYDALLKGDPKLGWYKEFVPFIGDQETFSQAKNWCYHEFGKEGKAAALRKWVTGYSYLDAPVPSIYGFFFQNDMDAMAFKLRWT